MKHFAQILVLITGIYCMPSLGAQAGASQMTPTGVVTVSFNTAVLQCAEAQHDLAALQSEYAPRQTEIKTMNDRLENERKQLQASADKLSDLQRSSRERSLNDLEKQLQRKVDDYKSDSQSESQQVYQRVAQKVYAFLQTYAKQHGYSVVVERGTDSAPVVWFALDNLDITNDLVRAYDASAGAKSSNSLDAPTSSRPSPPNAPKPH